MYMIACCDKRIVYSYHDKVYMTQSKAESALNIMKKNKKFNDDWKVYKISGLHDI